MCRPAVCTERDETLMQRGSLVRARNFGFPVHRGRRRRRLAAHIRRVRRRYELRGSVPPLGSPALGFPSPLCCRCFSIEISSRESRITEDIRVYTDCFLECTSQFKNVLPKRNAHYAQHVRVYTYTYIYIRQNDDVIRIYN